MLIPSTRNLIEDWNIGYVATVNADGTPNVSPKGSFAIHDDATIGFVDMRSPGTMENIARDPRVCVTFVDVLTRRGIKIDGTTRVITEGAPDYQQLIKPYAATWPELRGTFQALVLIDITRVRPLCSPSYDVGLETETLRARWMQRIRDINIKHKTQEVSEC